jgi:hypothetical protein
MAFMSDQPGRLRRAVVRVVSDDNLDLYVLTVAALGFTVLGATGISDVSWLLSMMLALLALLAFSQIRNAATNERPRTGAGDRAVRSVP